MFGNKFPCNVSEMGHSSVSTWHTEKKEIRVCYVYGTQLTNIKALAVMILEKETIHNYFFYRLQKENNFVNSESK